MDKKMKSNKNRKKKKKKNEGPFDKKDEGQCHMTCERFC